MTKEINLSSSSRNILRALSNTSAQIDETQNRIATALKVANAIDDAQSFFVAKSLEDRASDFLIIKDKINENLGLIETTSNGLASIDAIIDQMRGLVTSSTDEAQASSENFDSLIDQINYIISDTSYKNSNLLQNTAAAGEDPVAQTVSVPLNDTLSSKIDLEGTFSGISWYLKDGDAKLIPDDTNETFTAQGTKLSYSGAATASGTDFQINTNTSGDQDTPKVSALSGGGFIVVWESAGQDGSGEGIYAQIYDSTGTVSGSEFKANTTTTGLEYEKFNERGNKTI